MKHTLDFRKLLGALKTVIPLSFRKGPSLAALGAFLLSLAVVLGNISSGRSQGSLDEFEVGRVAERDVVAEQAITYEDEAATRLRAETQERLVPAVFHYTPQITEEALGNWKRFTDLAEDFFSPAMPADIPPAEASLPGVLPDQEDPSPEAPPQEEPDNSQETFSQIMEENFPGSFSPDTLDLFYDHPGKTELLERGTAVLTGILEQGIFSIPSGVLPENHNPEVAELVRHSGSQVERERIPYADMVTREHISEALESRINTGFGDPEPFHLVSPLVSPFITENVFLSPEETVQRLMETRAKIEPVMKYIERGQRVIRKGFIITEEDMVELGALNRSRENDVGSMVSKILLLLLLYLFMIFFLGERITGRELRDAEIYLVCALSALYICGTVFARNLILAATSIPVSLFMPTALVIMLPAILIQPRLALVMAMALPLGAFFSDSFDAQSFFFALVSGAAASFTLQGAEKRMDLVKAGLIIGGVNCVAGIALFLGRHADAGTLPMLLFWAAFNGVASSMLVLGFLSPLEQALSAATGFRLIELSDLNAPILRRLFTTAPGTYSHSIMVANLAESACQEIGANALLARVGAYYHDLGKMEAPYYFVENQSDYNPHDDMAPRLSATVIRSHVKVGVEKARQLKLPREVIDIIAEHHGNSVIAWFYSKALKQEGQNPKKAPVSMEDFCYQGNPPKSRESTVVMLADVTEAAVRTLDKPTQAKMEKFIRELFAAKVEHGQLARTELTYHDMERIQKSFVQVLVAHYHTRIEYPKIETPKPQDLGDEIPAGAPAASVAGAATTGGTTAAAAENGQ